MALEDFIDSEQEEKIYQKGQKRERFMHNFNSEVGPSMPGMGDAKKPQVLNAPVWMMGRTNPAKNTNAQPENIYFLSWTRIFPDGKTQWEYNYSNKTSDLVDSIRKNRIPSQDIRYESNMDPLKKRINEMTITQVVVIGTGDTFPGDTTPTKTGGGKIGGGTTPSKPASKSGCFIATAAYGTPMAQEIDVLRDFRDNRMLPTVVGKAFVQAYYRVSPPIAYLISRSETLKRAVRGVLTPIVRKRG